MCRIQSHIQMATDLKTCKYYTRLWYTNKLCEAVPTNNYCVITRNLSIFHVFIMATYLLILFIEYLIYKYSIAAIK